MSVASTDYPPSSSAALSEVHGLINESAARVERAISWIRVAFCTLVLLRFLVVTDVLTWARTAITVVPIAAALAFSLSVLMRPMERIGARTLYASVTLDAVVCFAALVPNALWPALNSPILMHKPDVAAILIVLVAGGFRLSLRAAVLSAVVNITCFVALIAIDVAVSAGPQPMLAASIYAVLLSAASGLAIVVGWKTEVLATASAARAVAAQIHRRNLGVLLRDHHDVRSSLSAATLSTELAARALTRDNTVQANAYLAAARTSLEEVNDASRRAREMSLEELDAMDAVAPADVAEVFARLQAMDHGIDVQFEGAASELVSYAGGRDGLVRSLRRLLHNAADGDGDRSAQRAWVRSLLAGAFVEIRVEDDGPGFSPAQLQQRHDVPVDTTKPHGTGMGLLLVRSAAEFSGGSFEKSNRPEGGARISVRLPRYEAQDRSV